MSEILFSEEYSKEMQAEVKATRNCLERIPETLFSYKPHEKSMALGYLALLVAEIPNWVAHIVEKGEIDLAIYPHFEATNTAELVKHFDENMQAALKALKGATNEQLQEQFALKNQGQVLFSSTKKRQRKLIHQSLGTSPRAINGVHAPQRYTSAIYLRTIGR